MKPILFTILATTACADTLQPLGDEFENPATFSRWQDIDEVEGWGVSTDEAADIAITTPGHFRIVPKSMGWFAHLRGVLFFKEVTGDFIVTTKLRVLSRHNPANPLEVPNRFYSLTGIFIHEPRPFITQAAPSPYRTDAVWPPAAFGSDYVPNTENYIFLSYGTAGNPGTRQFEIKATRNSSSLLYFNSTGINQASNEAWMQVVRVGNTVVCLRKYTENGAWIVENRYPNPDHPFPAFGATLQVGLTAYTDWENGMAYNSGGVQTSYWANYAAPTVGNPDLISEVDYLRMQRPPAELTEAVLQAMATSYNPAGNFTANPPILLSASPVAAPHLGDNANIPLGSVEFSAPSFLSGEGNTASVVVTRSGSSTHLPLSLNWQISPNTASGADYTGTSGSLSWAANDTASKTISIPLLADALAEGNETLNVVLSALDGPATFPDSSPTISNPLTIEDHPFDTWRLQQFGAEANSATAAPLADADLDGVQNLLEYVFRNPESHLPQIYEPAITLRVNCPASPGVRQEIQFSNNLTDWEAITHRDPGVENWAAPIAGFSIQQQGNQLEVSTTPTPSQPNAFLRFQATLP